MSGFDKFLNVLWQMPLPRMSFIGLLGEQHLPEIVKLVKSFVFSKLSVAGSRWNQGRKLTSLTNPQVDRLFVERGS